ncbi:Hypothetical protein PBC10988_39480 [Planctomycetales bacterium 10988]|nr:Hypothetical protein PBC10988_39480 [Planctomycetales bacterium 10988]
MRNTFGLKVSVLFILIVLFFALLGPSIFYILDERELAVITFFGNPTVERLEPGLYMKTPLHDVRRLPRTQQLWGGTDRDVLLDLPTKDGKKIEVIPWAIWRIKQPKEFVQSLKSTENAEERVKQYVRAAVRNVITKYELSELVRSSNRDMSFSFGVDSDIIQSNTSGEDEDPVAASEEDVFGGGEAPKSIKFGRQKILEEINQAARKELLGSDDTGSGVAIQLVTVGITKIQFVDRVQEAAFERQKAYMLSEAEKYTARGEQLKQEILNATEAEVQRIEGNGERRSRELRGDVEAEIIRSYAEAMEKTGEFYTFIRTLEAYRNALSSDTRLILTTKNDFLKLLKEYSEMPKIQSDEPEESESSQEEASEETSTTETEANSTSETTSDA